MDAKVVQATIQGISFETFIIYLLIPVLLSVFKYIHGRLNKVERKIEESDAKHTNEINSVKIKLSEEYVTKHEFTRFIDVVLAKIDQSNSKFEDKIDKHYERLDNKIEDFKDEQSRRELKKRDKNYE